ncbi:flagellin N-terminal helical domain-containing protein [Yunchengibacter salinarum]|uniref:flagellin N-terminal helical domain-containing protein n=1 Tax=Yunchengibacter salinarum TaxID=3133399 RepID=UPI0035B69F5E
MVSRISSFGQQQNLLQAIQQNQRRVFEAQEQISTGKKTDEFRGLAGKVNTLLGSESFRSRIQTYQRSIDTVVGKLDANDVQLGSIIDTMGRVKDTVATTVANDQAEAFDQMLDQSFRFVTNALNTNFDGTFLFSGTQSGQAPVQNGTLQDFINRVQARIDADGDGVADDVDGDGTQDVSLQDAIRQEFSNSDEAFSVRVADNVDIEFGVLAEDVGLEIFESFYRLGSGDLDGDGVNDGDPDFPITSGELTDAQFSFLQGEIGSLESRIDNMRQIQTNNGFIQSQMDTIREQHRDREVFLDGFIADIEDVDMAEAISRLQNDQVALQASFQSISTLSQLTLLNFI